MSLETRSHIITLHSINKIRNKKLCFGRCAVHFKDFQLLIGGYFACPILFPMEISPFALQVRVIPRNTFSPKQMGSWPKQRILIHLKSFLNLPHLQTANLYRTYIPCKYWSVALTFYVICLDKFELPFNFKGFHFRQKVMTGKRIFSNSWLV